MLKKRKFRHPNRSVRALSRPVTSCWYFLKPPFLFLLNFDCSKGPFFSQPRGIFYASQESILVLFGLTVLASENKTATLFCERKNCFVSSRKKSTVTFGRSGKKCTATTKRSINAPNFQIGFLKEKQQTLF